VLRLVAIAIFGLMFLAEAGDIYGLVLTLADPELAADRFSIAANTEVVRSSVLLTFALVVAGGALLAVVGLLVRMPKLFHRGAVACAVGYLVYGLVQVADGALQVGAGIVVVAGLIYMVLGGIAYAMHRSVRPG
jgi:hypothetical protein